MFDLGLSARTDIDIRPATRSDVEGIARVSVDTWRTTYVGKLPAAWLERLRYGVVEQHQGRFLGEPLTQHFVAVEPLTGEVVGFVNGGLSRQPRLGFDGELFELYVQEGFQRRGIGRGLFQTAQAALRDAGQKSLIVWVLGSNPNRLFYERLGGRMVARQPVRIGGGRVQEIAYAWD